MNKLHLQVLKKRRVSFSKREKRKYRLLLMTLFCVNLCLAGVWYFKKVDSMVPSHMYLFCNQNASIEWNVPLQGTCDEAKEVFAIKNDGQKKENATFALDRPVSVKASAVGSYQAELKFFGILPYKKIQFDVIEKAKVMPSGEAVGLYIISDGIMVLGTTKIEGKDGLTYEPAKDILQSGDCVTKVENKQVGNIDDVIDRLQKAKGDTVTLEVERQKQKIHVKIRRILTKDGQYKIGAWLREDTEGIGTLSFVTDKNEFAALGHGITDMDTGELIHLSKGKVYPAQIEDIQKGKAGNPGELIGNVEIGDYNRIGWIKSNTRLGITGTVLSTAYQYHSAEALPVGLKQEVKKGKAYIMCELGKQVKKYQVSIEEIDVNSTDNKGMVVRITDKIMLKRAGGIVQGMSGAPIIQNGKVIGAVTHVFVNDPTRGYGTFIENMLG